jgi:poly(A) polymerase
LDRERGIARVIVSLEGTDSHVVDLTSFSGEIIEDLSRRDFTINTLALPLGEIGTLNPKAGIIDPFGGMNDLRNGLIQAVQDKIFVDDSLRLLRAPRLAHQLGFAITEQTKSLIKRDALLLNNQAGERQREELLYLLDPPGALSGLMLLDQLGLLRIVFPDIELGRGVEQPNEHYWDVFEHNLQCVSAVEEVIHQCSATIGRERALEFIPWEENIATYFASDGGNGWSRATLLKLAALFHDVAKPHTKKIDSSGRIRFLGHNTMGAQLVETMAGRIRLSSNASQFLYTLVRQHLRPSQMSQLGKMPTPRAVYRFFRDSGDAAIAVLYLNLADYLAARGPNLDLDDWSKHVSIVKFILQERNNELTRTSVPLINGYDLMRELALPPGRHIGLLLTAIQEAQATGNLFTSDQAYAMARRILPQLVGV